MHPVVVLSPILVLAVTVSLTSAKFYRPQQYNLYKAGPNAYHGQGKPTGRHKNHCAYVMEKSVSYTMQDGAAPYVKAEYNRCSLGQKCPTLIYRLMYKPTYKVAYKTVTELEWRCCPGYSGHACMEGPPAFQHPMRMMPPFKGPPFKGPPFKSPQFKGLSPIQPGVKANPWSQSKGPPPPSNVKSYPMRHFGPPMTSYPEASSFEPFSSEVEPIPDHHHHQQQQQQPGPDHTEHEQEPEHESHPEETAPPEGGHDVDGQGVAPVESEERLDRVEEELRRLSQGLETLRGTVAGLEDGLRASLREDANRMLSTLLTAAPGPVPAPLHSAVGFGDIPGGDPDAEGLDGGRVFPGLAELTGQVEELRSELLAKSAELEALRGTVIGHGRALQKLSPVPDVAAGFPVGADSSQKARDEGPAGGRMAGAILDGFEKPAESVDVGQREEQEEEEEEEEEEQLVEQALDGSATGPRREPGNGPARIGGSDAAAGDCCAGTLAGLAERVHLLEQSVAGLNQSQGHLRAELGGHKDHVEGMLEGRLGYVEARLNLTGMVRTVSGGEGRERGEPLNGTETTDPGLEARLEGKLAALEGRLLSAVEELGNATALEGHVVRGPDAEPESLWRRLELDVYALQKQLVGLEGLCTSSCGASSSSTPPPPAGLRGETAAAEEEDDNMRGLLDAQGERLSSLNSTLQSLLVRLAYRDHQELEETGELQGELTVLRFNVRSVNHTLRGLRESVGEVVREVGSVNSTWQEREGRLAQQVRGVVQLVGRQASMLGAGERKLTRLKAELHELRRRLAGEVQGCRSTALGVQREVTEVGGRVASVEGQCKGLSHVAEDLERIRAELERQSDGYLLAQVNGTLSSHTLQLAELRDGLRGCADRLELTQHSQPQSPEQEAEAEERRGDQ